MSASSQRVGITGFYKETVLPALAAHLDTAFPEFGWRRDARGWVATNQEMTHRVLGVRADRVVAHGDAPAGFLIHGGEPTLWTAYVNGGHVPRAAEFADTVLDLARRAGVDTTQLSQFAPRDRRRDVLEAFAEICQVELMSDRGAAARAYLEARGIASEALHGSGLGCVPPRADSIQALHDVGVAEEEISRTGVLRDRRWSGRVVGAWRDERGRVGTMWARSIDPFADDGSKYLYLKGATRTDLPPYGLSDLVRLPLERRQEVLLVEGLLDVHQLRGRGLDSVAGLGGTNAPPSVFERMAKFGVESIVLAFDNDDAGRVATSKAVDAACRARTSPAIQVLDPAHLDDAKDPDAFVRVHGIATFQRLLGKAEPAVTWRAKELVVAPDERPMTRQTALARAGRWLGSLPPRLALEQEDAVKLVADRCGYSVEATVRAFQARFWREPSQQLTPRTHELDLSPGGR